MDQELNTWITVSVPGKNWDEIEQTYLGRVKWSVAVEIAKAKQSATRLCNTPGYNNQGHYFQPNKK